MVSGGDAFLSFLASVFGAALVLALSLYLYSELQEPLWQQRLGPLVLRAVLVLLSAFYCFWYIAYFFPHSAALCAAIPRIETVLFALLQALLLAFFLLRYRAVVSVIYPSQSKAVRNRVIFLGVAALVAAITGSFEAMDMTPFIDPNDGSCDYNVGSFGVTGYSLFVITIFSASCFQYYLFSRLLNPVTAPSDNPEVNMEASAFAVILKRTKISFYFFFWASVLVHSIYILFYYIIADGDAPVLGFFVDFAYLLAVLITALSCLGTYRGWSNVVNKVRRRFTSVPSTAGT